MTCVWMDNRTHCFFTLQTFKLTVNGAPFGVKCKNDELISLKGYANNPEDGAIMGVDMKKRLSWASVRQAQPEFLLFGQISFYPFCQVNFLCWR